ncbi:MAG: lytic transglycosylase domain-containing protein [Pseudolabrys sp.]|nr:lytic transglycosylase domain-containing protein [Pseudolabrys sp.]
MGLACAGLAALIGVGPIGTALAVPDKGSKDASKQASKDAAKKAANPPAKPSAKPTAKTATPPATAKVTVKLPDDAPLPRARPATQAATKPAAATPAPANETKRPGHNAFAQANVGLRGGLFAASATIKPMARPASGPFSVAPTSSTSAADIALVKQVIEATRKGNEVVADVAAKSITDPVARKLAEWIALRSDNTRPTFQRYANFVAANPSWPHSPLFRRRAENALWNDKIDDATVRAFFADRKPTTAKGRYVLARALLAQGNREGAAELVRFAWRYQDSSADIERMALETFGSMLTAADHKVRMDQRFYEDDADAGLRNAERLGGSQVAIARAWAAVIKKAGNAKALLDAVPAAAQKDAGYIYARAQWLRKNSKPEEAGKLILTASKDPAAQVDVNQWWQERRILIRNLLDNEDAQTAYRVARDAATPTQGNYRVDKHFTAGWIALRFLHDPTTAAQHFALINDGTNNPHALARGGYWEGRAAEAMGQQAQARSFYAKAAEHSATYYGQLARARLGLPELGLRGPPVFTGAERAALSNLEVVRAVEILYALDERDMLTSIFAELGESSTDVAGMAMLGETAGKHRDGRAMLMLGKGGLGRGLPLDYYAYPIMGLPDYTPIAPPVEPAVVYSIARQESHFNQKVVSPAKAMGFMQVTPVAAKDSSKRYKAPYTPARLLSDPVYNMQMGAAELSMLLSQYNGSYLMTFAGYNAGRGRVRQWVAAYGDPRDPKVDPVDWAERIPIAETRNYVQRIMENLQVYRARFGGGTKLLIEADIRRGATAN